MRVNTSELCDIFLEQVDVVEPIFQDFGGINIFAGQVVTIRCYEDNQLIYDVLSDDGTGKVLVIDAAAIIRTAIVDLPVVELAIKNNWEGLLINGAVRHVEQLEQKAISIKALTSIPVGVPTLGGGEIDVPVNFAGVTFLPEDFIYADLTGIILSAEALEF